MVRMVWMTVALLVACRDYQEDLPFEDCQPYILECALCTFDDDVLADEGLRRTYRCETADGLDYDAVLRDGQSDDGDPTDDVHYYDPDEGYRLAAERRHDADVDVCGKQRDVEWWGEILDDCEVVCEIDPSLPDADSTLPACD